MIENLRGFSLMELLIALVIVGILSAIAIPTYNNYTKRAYFSEIVLAAHPYKVSVMECFVTTGDLSKCNGGKNGIPKNITKGSDAINTITTENAIITITPSDQNGITEKDTYILTPTARNGRLKWTSSGGAVSDGLTK
mgnify:CR=1 FL=1